MRDLDSFIIYQSVNSNGSAFVVSGIGFLSKSGPVNELAHARIEEPNDEPPCSRLNREPGVQSHRTCSNGCKVPPKLP